MRTDEQLVALFRAGNEDAFRVIHDRYRVRLLAYTRQMLAGSHADAEDALQDVFLRAYGALRADDRPVTLRAWLYRVAHNRCIDHVRRPANQPTSELAENVSSLQDPAADVQRRDDLRRLVADVARLPEQQRSALLMREMEGLTYVELAGALGTTVPSVKSLLVRARIGLTEAREARDTACVAIRAEVMVAHDRGVRLGGLARRHVRDCSHCEAYRGRLRGVRAGLAALGGTPSAWGALAKLFGLGGAGGGAAATAGGGGTLAGGAIAAGGTVKVAALVCSVAVVGGGAVEVTRELSRPTSSAAAAPARPAVARAAQGATLPTRAERPGSVSMPAPAAPPRRSRPAEAPPTVLDALAATAAVPAPRESDVPGASSSDGQARQAATAGGMLAPEEPEAPVAPETSPLGPDLPEDTPVQEPSTPASDAAEQPGTGTTGPG